jgi:8-oxo-dGTP pyrophosphatase MutT (NUDIX family)
MTIMPWKILETTYIHSSIRVDTCELPDGRILTPHILDYDDEIMIFALTRAGEVVLIWQYRHGIQEVILELPGGSVDKGETPLEAAKRELMEETGYVSDTFIEVVQASPNPAIYRNRVYSFLALDVKSTGNQSAYDAGAVEVILIPLDEVIAMAKKGQLINSLNISTLFFVLGHLERNS